MKDNEDHTDGLEIQPVLLNLPMLFHKHLEHHHHHCLETMKMIMENHGIIDHVLPGTMVVAAEALEVEGEDREVVEVIFHLMTEVTDMKMMFPPTLEEDLEVVEDPQAIQEMVNMTIGRQRTLIISLTMPIGHLMGFIIERNHHILKLK